jgi:hypothetical protein
MGILGAAGGILGGLFGAARASMLHLPPAVLGQVLLRFGLAGVAFGASVPPAIKALGSILKAALWWILAMVLWWTAFSLLGNAGWMTRWIR